MKIAILSDIITKLAKDRFLMVLFGSFILLSIILCLYVGFSLHSFDIQIATRYTSFGATNYYRNQWYYLFTFLAFGLFALGLNTTIAIKLGLEDRIELAKLWLILSSGLVVVAIILVHSVLSIAYL